MFDLLLTPTNPSFLPYLMKDPITNQWVMPTYVFNVKYPNPFFSEVDPLQTDPKYQKKIIDNIYTRLCEKWLYNDSEFKKLLRYFKVDIDSDQAKITLLIPTDPENTPIETFDPKYNNHVFKYIEKYFITIGFVDKTLRQYISSSNTKWYDIFYNIDTIKEILATKLKKLIISTIYEVRDILTNIKKDKSN